MKRYVKLYENFSGIEDKARLSQNIGSMLNDQIQKELESSQIYRAMSCWFDDKGWPGGQKLFFKYADEELIHMNKVYQYMFEKNTKAITPACEAVQGDFKDAREIVEISLNHEMEVTKNWNDIAEAAKKEDDNDTYMLAQWFINEQREEEIKMRDLLFKIRMDMPPWRINDLFESLV